MARTSEMKAPTRPLKAGTRRARAPRESMRLTIRKEIKTLLFLEHLIEDRAVHEMLFLGGLPAAKGLVDGNELELGE